MQCIGFRFCRRRGCRLWAGALAFVGGDFVVFAVWPAGAALRVALAMTEGLEARVGMGLRLLFRRRFL
jgi:hypothetical protein